MKLFNEHDALTISFTAEDCRVLARLARAGDLPERFKGFSIGLEASAVAMDRRERSGELRGGDPLQEPELSDLKFEDILALLEIGVNDYPNWRETYRRLSAHLSPRQDEELEWDWTMVTDTEPAAGTNE